jgi:hypothetical protein
MQLPADLPDGGSGGPLGEDAPHDRGLWFVDLQVGLAGRCAARHPPVSVGRLPGDDLTGAGAEQLAPPIPFADLRPLVFGNHALHLGEQGGLRIVGCQAGRVGERDGDPEAGQLIENQDLVGVGAGEPVRGQAPHPVDEARLGGVSQRVQPGTVQSGAGVPVIDVLADQLVSDAGDVLAQQPQL